MKYEDAVRKGKEVANSQWTLGDLALEVEPKYGENTLERFADDIGVEFKTLSEYRWVAKQYENTVRTVNLSWSVHKIFAAQEDRAGLIGKKKWTAKQAREFVQHRTDDDNAEDEFWAQMGNVRKMTLLAMEALGYFHDTDRRKELRDEEDLCNRIIEMIPEDEQE